MIGEFAILAFSIFCVLALVVPAFYRAVIVGTTRGTQNDYARFMADATARGLTYTDAVDEWKLRTELVRLRRVASDAVAGNYADWFAVLERTKKEAIERIVAIDPKLADAFAVTVYALTFEDILHPDEAQIVRRMETAGLNTPMSTDQAAALRG